MVWVLVGLALGVMVGYYIPITYPGSYSLYISIMILACLDSVFGAIRAGLDGKYNNIIFATGFFGNAVIAGLLTYIGDRVGVPLYYAAILVFGGRLFDNVAIIRRHLVDNFMNKKRGN